MVTREHYAVCFYVKRTWIRLKAVEMGDAVFFFPVLYLLFVFIFKKPTRSRTKFSFLFSDAGRHKTVRRFLFLFIIRPRYRKWIRVCFGYGCILYLSRLIPALARTIWRSADMIFLYKIHWHFLCFQKDVFHFWNAFRYKIVTSPVKTGFEMLFLTPVHWHNTEFAFGR